MSIRYECEECGSVLKIKESLAGTSGKCPECKHKFTVPEKGTESPSDSKIESKASAATNGGKPATKSPPKTNGEEFDLDAFLMDEAAPGAKTTAGLGSASAAPPPPPKPMVDSQGRRAIAAPPPSPGSSAEMPTRDPANTAVNASANARDLLTKTMEDGRLKASAQASAPKGPRFDYDIKGSLSQIKQYAAYIVGGIVLVIGLYWLSDQMMGQHIALPELADVSGTVNLNGNPLPEVVVHLTPVNAAGSKESGSKVTRLRDATGVTDANGYYSVEYMSGVSGAPLGRARIWLEPMNPADFTKIPASYLKAGSDMRDVKEAGNEGKFNLDLKSP